MITNNLIKEIQAYLTAIGNTNNSKGKYSADVLEKLIVLFGDANTGKTQSLMEFGRQLGMPLHAINTANIRVILHPLINGQKKTVFLSTFGDTVNDVMNNIRFFNMSIPSGCKIYEVINGQLVRIRVIKQIPTICIGASRVEEMHWEIYDRFANIILPKTPKPIMFRKLGTKPKPKKGTLTIDDIKTIDSIRSIL